MTFYRCHACSWRAFRITRGWKGLGAYALSLIGYCATIGLTVAIIAGLFALALSYLGLQMP